MGFFRIFHEINHPFVETHQLQGHSTPNFCSSSRTVAPSSAGRSWENFSQSLEKAREMQGTYGKMWENMRTPWWKKMGMAARHLKKSLFSYCKWLFISVETLFGRDSDMGSTCESDCFVTFRIIVQKKKKLLSLLAQQRPRSYWLFHPPIRPTHADARLPICGNNG